MTWLTFFIELAKDIFYLWRNRNKTMEAQNAQNDVAAMSKSQLDDRMREITRH